MDAKPLLARLLESRKASLRGAAAAALLRLGWGVGLGSLTTTAISVLEHLCGVSLGDEELLSLPKLASRQASHKEASLHRTHCVHRVSRISSETLQALPDHRQKGDN